MPVPGQERRHRQARREPSSRARSLGALCARTVRQIEVIVADYAATQENLDAIIERLMSTKGYHTILSALPPDTLHAEPETMVVFLDRMREADGSMEAYAAAAGVQPDAVAKLRSRLLE